MRIMLMCFIGALVFGVSLVDEVKADLLWHLEFEGNLLDTAGHASGPYNGSEVKPPIDPGVTEFVPDGRVGQALSFDGNSVRIDIPGTATAMSEFTVSLFQKSDVAFYDMAHAFVTKPAWTTGNFVMRTLPNDDMEMYNNVGNVSTWVDGTFFSGVHPFYMNRWNHFAITYSVTAGEAKLYIDGALVNTGTGASEPVEFNDGFTLGAWNFSTTNSFDSAMRGRPTG